jgi:hypothetical protein
VLRERARFAALIPSAAGEAVSRAEARLRWQSRGLLVGPIRRRGLLTASVVASEAHAHLREQLFAFLLPERVRFLAALRNSLRAFGLFVSAPVRWFARRSLVEA